MTKKVTQSALFSTLRVLKSFICDVAMTVVGISSTGDITTTANMEAVDGTFTGDVSAVGGTFTGDVSAANAEVTGVLDADTIRDDGYEALTPTTDVSVVDKSRVVREATFTIDASKSTGIETATPYGGVNIGALPADNVIVLGAILDIAVTAVNITPDADLEVALGTTETTSVDFSNAGEDNLIEAVSPSSSTVKSASGTDGGISNVLLAAGAGKDLWVNFGSNPAPSSDGSAAVASGTVTVFYIDLDDHS